MPSISVIMLTYNREKLVARMIESILSQTFSDFEFIVIDNGSTDNSGAIADRYAGRDSRMKVIHREAGNVGSGRNAGLDIASGSYISFVDDDDYAEPDFLEFLWSLVESYHADIGVCGSYKLEDGIVSENGNFCYEKRYVMDAMEAVSAFLKRDLYNCAMPTKLVRRTMFQNIRFADTGKYDDINTTYKLFAAADTVVANGLPKYTFYRHPDNNSSDATKFHLLNPEQLREYLSAFRERTEYITAMLPRLRKEARYSEWSYMISMLEKINRFSVDGCGEICEYMRKSILDNLDEFLYGGYIQEFERKWVEEYICRN